jgi:hypothetical protein
LTVSWGKLECAEAARQALAADVPSEDSDHAWRKIADAQAMVAGMAKLLIRLAPFANQQATTTSWENRMTTIAMANFSLPM